MGAGPSSAPVAPAPAPWLPARLPQLAGVMEELQKLLQWLSSTLDNRVFVALTRGLWDLASKDVLQYAEDLTEGEGHQVGGCVWGGFWVHVLLCRAGRRHAASQPASLSAASGAGKLHHAVRSLGSAAHPRRPTRALHVELEAGH